MADNLPYPCSRANDHGHVANPIGGVAPAGLSRSPGITRLSQTPPTAARHRNLIAASEASPNRSGSARMGLGILGQTALINNHCYLVSKLLGTTLKLPGLKGTIPITWRMKNGLSVHDAGDRYLFLFENRENKKRLDSWVEGFLEVEADTSDGILEGHDLPIEVALTFLWMGTLKVGERRPGKVSWVKFISVLVKAKVDEKDVADLAMKREIKVIGSGGGSLILQDGYGKAVLEERSKDLGNKMDVEVEGNLNPSPQIA